MSRVPALASVAVFFLAAPLSSQSATPPVDKKAFPRSEPGHIGAAGAKAVSPPRDNAPQPAARTSFVLQLRDGTRLVGRPARVESVKLQTEFAEMTVPVRLVGQITRVSGSSKVRIGFRNGDGLTGRLTVDRLPFKTAYGTLTVPAAEIVWLGAEGFNRPPATPTRPTRVAVRNRGYAVHTGLLEPGPPAPAAAPEDLPVEAADVPEPVDLVVPAPPVIIEEIIRR